ELEHYRFKIKLLRPDVVGHDGAVGVAGRQFAADVPELLEVVGGGPLGRLDAEGGVAAGAAAVGQAVFQLHRLGQGEQGVREVLGPFDQLGRNAVVGDDGETEALE